MKYKKQPPKGVTAFFLASCTDLDINIEAILQLGFILNINADFVFILDKYVVHFMLLCKG